MALQSNISYTQNQPQKIDTPESSCIEPLYDYKTIINADDVTKMQFRLYPRRLSTELATNAEFSVDASWANTDMSWNSLLGGYYYNDTASNFFGISQTLTNVSVGAFIEVTVNFLENKTGGSINIDQAQIPFPAGIKGDMKFYAMMTSIPAVFVYYGGVTTYQPNSLVIGYIRVKEVPLDYKFFLRNTRTDLIESSFNVRSYVNAANPNGSGPFRLINNYLTYEHDWAGIDEGCYRIEIADQTLNTNTQNNLFNGDFLVNDLNSASPYDSVNWFSSVFNSTAAITGGQLVITFGAAGFYTFYVGSTLKAGSSYNISLDAGTGIGGGTYSFGYGNQGAQTSVVLANGADHTDTIVGNGDQLAIGFFNPSGAITIKINSISVTLQDDNELEGNYISNDFILTNSSCNTVEISACNDVDSFGFSFPLSSFSLNTRLLGAATNPKYDFDRDTYTKNSGNNRTTYYRRQKVKVIKIDFVPEFVLDFLTLLGGMDHIYIDDVEYSPDKDEFISISYNNELDNFAQVQLFLFQKDSTATNKVTTALGVGCGTDVEYLEDPEDITDPNDDTYIIDPQTGDPIIFLQ